MVRTYEGSWTTAKVMVLSEDNIVEEEARLDSLLPPREGWKKPRMATAERVEEGKWIKVVLLSYEAFQFIQMCCYYVVN